MFWLEGILKMPLAGFTLAVFSALRKKVQLLFFFQFTILKITLSLLPSHYPCLISGINSAYSTDSSQITHTQKVIFKVLIAQVMISAFRIFFFCNGMLVCRSLRITPYSDQLRIPRHYTVICSEARCNNN